MKWEPRYAIALAATLLFIGLAFPAMLRSHSEWMQVYVRAGETFLRGDDFYQPGIGYSYPPFMVLLGAPFAALPAVAGRALWYLVNVGCIVGLLRGAWRLAGGPAPVAGSHEWLAAALGLACAATFILNVLAHQQTDLVIGVLLIAGCLALARGHATAGGGLLGVAAACKATPLLFAAYLLWRRQFAALGALLAVAIALNVLPDLIRPAPDGNLWLRVWLERLVLPTQAPSAPLGLWASDPVYNQSLAGLIRRIAVVSPDAVAKGLIDGPGLKLVAYSLMAALLVLTATGFRLAERRPAPAGARPAPIAFEFSAVIALMLLLSPMSSLAHFSTLILPAFCLARLAVQGSGVGWTAIATALLLALPANKDLVGGPLYTAALCSGSVTFATLALWAGCVLSLGRGKHGPSRPRRPPHDGEVDLTADAARACPRVVAGRVGSRRSGPENPARRQ